ncbi:MAG TPA: c-type cytochrome [Gemmatimonadales bacterium]|nr:c-type cytochrome [Gemmatimonadales bacterium]
MPLDLLLIRSLLLAALVPSAGVVSAQEAAADRWHHAPRDTVSITAYQGWQQYSLQCARCHGEDALGTSFAPDLVLALKPDGDVPTREAFLAVLAGSREPKGMPSAARLGIDPVYFDGLYEYLKGRSEGRLKGGRPARREE